MGGCTHHPGASQMPRCLVALAPTGFRGVLGLFPAPVWPIQMIQRRLEAREADSLLSVMRVEANHSSEPLGPYSRLRQGVSRGTVA
ncbi:hypothetical protein NDU88_003030 [Pleurodeles waltl]|uniref:Uncharacterized protein n=1 Tax=Pleurodeles waltl TaxID=8319 RepID=A0AAV7KTQ8_PLEWA|nr:hypothetical protein NDU88_003030 [Pleurodeles waltl]